MSRGSLIGFNLGNSDRSYQTSSLLLVDTIALSDIRIEYNTVNAKYLIQVLNNPGFQLSNVIFNNNRVIYEKNPYEPPLIGCLFYQSGDISLNNIEIKNNEAACLEIYGYPGKTKLSNVNIINNSRTALSCQAENFYAENLTIMGSGSTNILTVDTLTIKNSTIAYNRAGLNIRGTSSFSLKTVVNIEGTSIHDNQETGLLLHLGLKEINLSTQNLNSIYNNKGITNDIKSWNYDVIAKGVVLDTFTTAQNTFVYTTAFTLDSAHNMTAKIIPVSANHYISTQINANLYVSPDGSNEDSGLSPEQPFKTICHALDVIYADSLNPKTIHLAPGIYSESTNDEKFPLRPVYGVSIIGKDPQNTILDGEGNQRILYISNFFVTIHSTGFPPKSYASSIDQKLLLKNLTIRGGLGDGFQADSIINDAAVMIENGSNVRFERCIIAGNTGFGVAVNYHATPVFINCSITDEVGWGQSIANSYLVNSILTSYYDYYSLDPIIVNSMIGIDPDTVFNDPANGDYTLLEGSVAIDAGTAFYADDSGNVLIDLDPTQYAGSAPDLGAIEYGYVSRVNSLLEVPQKYLFFQNYPNPFNPVTSIRFYLPKSGNITIEIFNALGQRIEVLINKNFLKGEHTISFDGRNYSSGIYFYKIETGEFTSIKKMLLLK